MLSISSILSPLGALILSMELLVSSSLWKLAINDGLRQYYDYEFWKTFNMNVSSFHTELFMIIPYLLVFSAIYSSVYLIISKNGRVTEILFKFSESVLVFVFSTLFINALSIGTMDMSRIMFSFSTNWPYYFSISYMISHISLFFSSKSSILEIVFDGIYLTSAISIMGFLMLRVAILIVLYITLPFVSLLTGIEAFRKLILKLWVLYIQLLLSPILILLIIYFYINYTGFFFIQLGFLSLLSILPYSFIYTSYRLNNSHSGMFSSFFLMSGYGLLSSSIGKGIDIEKKRHMEKGKDPRSQNPELYSPGFFRINEDSEGYDE